MNKPNYRKQMDEITASLQREGIRKRLLLHACCAPCSTYCLELLTEFFDVTVLFYNPNITEEAEYAHRLEEEKRLIGLFNERFAAGNEAGSGGVFRSEIRILESRYDPERFFETVKGLEAEPEGGARCAKCFSLRLNEAAAQAALHGFDFFTTTLTISPLKNADVLNETGLTAGNEHGVAFLPSDFKKKDGFKRSVELSEAFDLYRQDYCGCIYSKAERSCAKCRAECVDRA